MPLFGLEESQAEDTSKPASRLPAPELPVGLIERAIPAASGRAPDLIEAHKWLNPAAMAGDEAVRHRRELAAEKREQCRPESGAVL